MFTLVWSITAKILVRKLHFINRIEYDKPLTIIFQNLMFWEYTI